jgi:hypothetical protein
MTTLAARKVAELAAKLAALDADLAGWLAASERSSELEKHHTQVRRLASMFERLRARVAKTLSREDAVLERGREVEDALIGLHVAWDFFRSKLALHQASPYRDVLEAADELAWQCYRPVRDAAVRAGTVTRAALREPPLTFFADETSPFVLQRGAPPDDPTGALTALRQCITAMPIPLIGVPWYQLRHLPDALVVCHEVGHAIENDLELERRTGALVDGVTGVPGERRALWRQWRHEVFADVFGAVVAGPAFAWSMHDFLAESPGVIEAERRGPDDDYPTCTLRVLVIAEVLRLRGFAKDADGVEEAWRSVYARHAMDRFETDAPEIARALLEGPYPELGAGARLDDAIGFTAHEHAAALEDAKLVAKRIAPLGNGARTLYAAAALAFQADPAAVDAARQQVVLKRILASREPGVRGPAEAADAKEKRAAADEDAADALVATLAAIGKGAGTPPRGG